MVQEIRKGPWTEKEDFQLVFFVGLFGERRWDFIAKVSGLNRTGKSCRLRWVNYLHPGLKRGKLTTQEERLVLELHSKWGNRWSRIAHKLPGRTDNEIKNYWRTYMRKKAQESKRTLSSSSSSSSFNYSSSSSSNPTMESLPFPSSGSERFYDTEAQTSCLTGKNIVGDELCAESYSMDDIWREMELSEDNTIEPAYKVYGEGSCNFVSPTMPSPAWEYNPESIWRADEKREIFGSVSDQFLFSYEQEQVSLNSSYFSFRKQEHARSSG